jgi:hypothetical protein
MSKVMSLKPMESHEPQRRIRKSSCTIDMRSINSNLARRTRDLNSDALDLPDQEVMVAS